MKSSLKLIGLILALFTKVVLSYYEFDFSPLSVHSDCVSAAHLKTTNIQDGPFVFEDQSRSENEDDNLDDYFLPGTSTGFAHLTIYTIHDNQNQVAQKSADSDLLFILYRNFRL